MSWALASGRGGGSELRLSGWAAASTIGGTLLCDLIGDLEAELEGSVLSVVGQIIEHIVVGRFDFGIEQV